MMQFKTEIRGRQFACNSEREGIFELIGGAYRQHRGTGQTPAFRDEEHFRRYVLRMLGPVRRGRPVLPDGLTEPLQLRVTRAGMASYEAAAKRAGVSLADWVRVTLDAAPK